MLLFPNRCVRDRDVEPTEADALVGRDVQLEIVAWGKGDPFGGINRFEDKLFDEGGNIAIADDAEVVGFLRARADATWVSNVEMDSAMAFFAGISGEAAAGGGACR